MTAETSNARSEWPARYMANGPQGTFYTDDLKLADALLRAYDEDDDWTVTEMPDPSGTLAAPQPPSAPVGVEGRYHPCTHILIGGLKRLEGGTAVLAEWDRARAQADAALGAYPTPRNRAEAVALARLALAHLGVIDAHIDAAIARCETDLATQTQGDK